MRKLLLVVFSILAINAQGQSLTEEPIVITAKSEIAHFFVANPFLYTITESSKDYIVDIYNDELKKIRPIYSQECRLRPRSRCSLRHR